MLNIIYAKSGFGKTGIIYENIKKDVENGKRAFLIVPEQQSVISEKQIVSLCSNRCNMYLEVLNFTRLCNRVFREYGGMSRKYIDGGGKMLILADVLEELEGQLEQYADSVNSDFISRLSAQLDNLNRRGSAGQLNDILNTDNEFDGILKGKLHDISLIHTAYKAKLHENYSDPLDDMDRLCEALDEFYFFEDANVYIDGFYEFCAGEMNVIRRIVNQADNVYISLAGTGDVLDESLEICRSAFNKLKELGENVNVITPDIDIRTCTEGLKYLKDNIFNEFALPNDKTDGVNVTVCRNIYEECIASAHLIKRLVKEENIRYSDISVAVRNPDSYRGIIDLYFEKYGIPFFMSVREDITLKPLLSFVFSALECVSESYRLQAVQRYLKSGLSSLDGDEIFLLESYLITWNINSKSAWEKEWTMHPDGYGETFEQKHKEKLEKLNSLRKRVFEPLSEMGDAMKHSDIKQRCTALYEFLARREILAGITEKCNALREKGDYSAANEEMTVWNILMNCLDQMVLIMGKRNVSAEKFRDILKLLCSSCSSARIPGALDQVQIGEAGHMRTDSVKHTIVLGMCENEFPKPSDGGALLSEKELKTLAELGIDAGESGEYSGYREKMFFYLELARPTHGIHLMWRTNDMTGGELTKSSFVHRVQKVLTEVKDEEFDSYSMLPVCENEGFDYLLANHASDPVKLAGLYEFYKNHPDYMEKLEYLRTAHSAYETPQRLSPCFFEGKDMYMSQSSFEKYINCRYSYFVSNLLGVKPEKRAKVDFSIVGTFVHAVLEKFMLKTGGKVRDMSDEDILSVTDEITQQYITENLPDFDSATPRFKYLIDRISKTALLTVHSLVDELRQSLFEPAMLEARIGDGAIQPYEIELKDGSKLIFKGIVDRIDTYTSPSGEEFVRIMDYKTGKSSGTFKLKEVLNGFKLQMLIYLFSVRRGGITVDGIKHDVTPAGILYVPAMRPKVEGNVETGSEEYLHQIETSFKRSGLILENEEIVSAMEKNPGSVYLPVKIKDGQLCAGESLATLEMFGSLENYIKRLASGHINCLKDGNIDINPFKYGKDSCEYCENYPVCRFEGKGRRYETVNDLEEAWQEIRKGEEE
ncbi:MAG: hypothetical protein E7588_08285 [Ruminococcaceae bacterium]|nr:hypothetical protein [Oscillospiraceae bacterium]